MHEFVEKAASYIVAGFALLSANIDAILQWGGLILLLLRLVSDAPRAWAVVRKVFKRD